MVVADSTVLIVLARVGRLDILRRLYETVLVAPTVVDEVVGGGNAKSSPEVVHVQLGISEGWINPTALTGEEKELSQKLITASRLDQGEAESIAIAKSRGLKLLLDDLEARALAASMGVKYVGTVGSLLEAYARWLLKIELFEEAVGAVARTMWLPPDVVAEALRRARGMKR